MGAKLLWPCAQEFHALSQPISLAFLILVLPIVLHRRSRELIHNMNKKDGSINKAINKKHGGQRIELITGKDLFIGLQERIHFLTPLTMQSLNVGIAANLFAKASNDDYGFPTFATVASKLPPKLLPSNDLEIKEYIQASERLGAWFLNTNLETVYSCLKIKV